MKNDLDNFNQRIDYLDELIGITLVGEPNLSNEDLQFFENKRSSLMKTKEAIKQLQLNTNYEDYSKKSNNLQKEITLIEDILNNTILRTLETPNNDEILAVGSMSSKETA